MTAKMLQLVNSAFFGIARKISNPVEAVQLLGVGTVRSLALCIHAFSCFDQAKLKEFSFERIWSHSVLTGIFAKKIAQAEGAESMVADEAFIAGLLHDLGKLMFISNMTDQYREAAALVQNNRLNVLAAEQKLFAATHADVGAYLLGLWGLPVSVVEAVALHHTPGKTLTRTFSPLTAVHVANVLEHEHSSHTAPDCRPLLDEGYLTAIGSHERLSQWRRTVATHAENVAR
jgi:HD-like signal output (HDOD) protein